MPRPQVLLAGAAVMALILGLLPSRLAPSISMAMGSSRAHYEIPSSLLFYGVALFLCLFAFLYSIWMVPWSMQLARWHFGLSVLAVMTFLSASILMTRLKVDLKASTSGIPLLLTFSLSPLFFLLLQAVFLIDGLRRSWSLFFS